MQPHSFTYSRKYRLSGTVAFAEVFEAGVRESRGPLLVYSRRNDLRHGRWGFSVSRRVGSAAVRNRVKRMLRESIRLLQSTWPRGYDCVVVVRPHTPMKLVEYQKILGHLMLRVHEHWSKKPEIGK